jgi:hypothetical protein
MKVNQSKMTSWFHIVLLAFSLPVVVCATSTPALAMTGLQLSDAGLSAYKIVISGHATTDENNASKELQKYLRQVSGATLPIVTDATPAGTAEILIGNNNRLSAVKAGISFQQLGPDGFIIKTVGNDLLLAGGNGRSNTYAVYTFLEKYIGCRKYTPDFAFIPHKPNITIPYIKNDTEIPQFTLRDVNFYADPEYCDWRKLQRVEKDPEWGQWVVPFTSLVPAKNYFSSHPEYFALYNGKRVPDQLCMTNDDVFRIAVENLKKLMAQNPTAKYWTVCQNDSWSHCQCPNCAHLDALHGNRPQGSLLTMVNRIAEQFPDKIIATHAYIYSLAPPANGLKPDNNVLIVFSTINCNRAVPIATDPQQGDLRNYLAGWNKLTDKLYIWDYVVQFSNYLSPFPNISTLQPNYQFYAKNGASGIFAQATGYLPGDLSELKSYLISNLMWDPNCDVPALESDFIGHFYGAAGPTITEYINLRESQIKSSSKILSIYDKASDESQGYLSPDLLKKYIALLNQAETLVRSDSASLAHVKIAKIPVEYAILRIPIQTQQSNKTGARGLRSAAKSDYDVDADQVYQQLVNDCKKYKIDIFSNYQGTYTLENLIKDYSNSAK